MFQSPPTRWDVHGFWASSGPFPMTSPLIMAMLLVSPGLHHAGPRAMIGCEKRKEKDRAWEIFCSTGCWGCWDPISEGDIYGSLTCREPTFITSYNCYNWFVSCFIHALDKKPDTPRSLKSRSWSGGNLLTPSPFSPTTSSWWPISKSNCFADRYSQDRRSWIIYIYIY